MKIAPEAPKIELGRGGHAVLRAYLSLLLIGGHVGLPLVLGTMIVSHTASRRYPTLTNMLVSWIVYSTAALLLFYSGEYQSRQPNFGLCLAQASLIYGATVMIGAATLCLVLQLWIDLRGRSTTYMSFKTKILLVGMPWLSLILMIVFVSLYGSINKSKVSYRWLFYCTISSNAVIDIVSGLTLLSVATMFCFQISILRTLYRVSRRIRPADRTTYSMSVRVSAFAFLTLLSFIIFGINVLIPDLIFPYLFIATLPLSAFAIFGTSEDNVAVWTRCFRRRRRRRQQQEQQLDDNAVRLQPIAFRTNKSPNTTAGTTTTSVVDPVKTKARPIENLEKDLPPLPDSIAQLLPADDTENENPS